jgi:hypothetical protein
MMLKTVLMAAVALPLGFGAALAGGGGCNWSAKENTVAQTPAPTPAPMAAVQTPVPAPASTDTVKLDVAQAAVPATTQPKTN